MIKPTWVSAKIRHNVISVKKKEKKKKRKEKTTTTILLMISLCKKIGPSMF